MSLLEDREATGVTVAGLEDSADENAHPRNTPLVSVVIACYNSARYLADTLNSVARQTHPRIEIIVVDDGSTDATATIAKTYPVTYLRQENQGVSVARNHGFQHCRGKYIQFLDHDDRLLPKAIETGVRQLEQHPEVSMAVGEHRYITASGNTIGYSKKMTVKRDYYMEMLKHNFIETPCSVLHRRSDLPETGPFDVTVQGAEDYELYLRIARHRQLLVHEAVVAEYRLHDDSLSRNAERMMLVTNRVLEMELPFLEGSRAKRRQLGRGCHFARRLFGRRLTRELLGCGRVRAAEGQRKLEVLRHYYPLGFVAVAVSRLVPMSLLHH